MKSKTEILNKELILLSSALELRDWTLAASTAEMRELLYFKMQYAKKKYSFPEKHCGYKILFLIIGHNRFSGKTFWT